MSVAIPEKYQDLLEKPAFGHLGTIMADGQPQVTVVWLDYHDGQIWLNSAKGRKKDENMRERPRVSLCVTDPENPYRYMEIRGEVVEIAEEGADNHIDGLSLKYMGQASYPFRRSDEVRVIYKIDPVHVNAYG